MTMQMTASLLLAELRAIGPVIEPTRGDLRLAGIEISERDGRPIAVFTYDSGAQARLGIGDAEHGIVAFAKDGVVVAFARIGGDGPKALGLDFSSREALDAAGVRVVTCIERLRREDVALCVGPAIDADDLDARPRFEGVIPSLTSDELAVARASRWTPAERYQARGRVEQDRRFDEAKARVESRRDPRHVPAWGVGAANADAAPTPAGRARLGRMGRR
jgi:hypothetical protein